MKPDRHGPCLAQAHDIHNVISRPRGLAGIRVEEIYAISRAFPRDELFGLTAQLRKAAVSIPSNIGEGARRKRRKVTLNHYDIALGSQGEVDVQLGIAKRLGYCSSSEYARLRDRVDRVGRMLNGLIVSIQPEGPWSRCLVTLGLL